MKRQKMLSSCESRYADTSRLLDLLWRNVENRCAQNLIFDSCLKLHTDIALECY